MGCWLSRSAGREFELVQYRGAGWWARGPSGMGHAAIPLETAARLVWATDIIAAHRRRLRYRVRAGGAPNVMIEVRRGRIRRALAKA